jgi:hypothetical protein
MFAQRSLLDAKRTSLSGPLGCRRAIEANKECLLGVDFCVKFTICESSPVAEGRFGRGVVRGGAGRGTCVRGSQPRTRAAAG